MSRSMDALHMTTLLGATGYSFANSWLPTRSNSPTPPSSALITMTPTTATNSPVTTRRIRQENADRVSRVVVQNLKTTAAALSLQALPGVRSGVGAGFLGPVVYTEGAGERARFTGTSSCLSAFSVFTLAMERLRLPPVHEKRTLLHPGSIYR
jgi:hypothetical protein